MRLLLRFLLIGAAVGLLAGCESTQPRTSGTDSTDVRRDQAERQTQRDVQRKAAKPKTPLEERRQDRQDVIDQPR